MASAGRPAGVYRRPRDLMEKAMPDRLFVNWTILFKIPDLISSSYDKPLCKVVGKLYLLPWRALIITSQSSLSLRVHDRPRVNFAMQRGALHRRPPALDAGEPALSANDLRRSRSNDATTLQ